MVNGELKLRVQPKNSEIPFLFEGLVAFLARPLLNSKVAVLLYPSFIYLFFLEHNIL